MANKFSKQLLLIFLLFFAFSGIVSSCAKKNKNAFAFFEICGIKWNSTFLKTPSPEDVCGRYLDYRFIGKINTEYNVACNEVLAKPNADTLAEIYDYRIALKLFDIDHVLMTCIYMGKGPDIEANGNHYFPTVSFVKKVALLLPEDQQKPFLTNFGKPLFSVDCEEHIGNPAYYVKRDLGKRIAITSADSLKIIYKKISERIVQIKKDPSN